MNGRRDLTYSGIGATTPGSDTWTVTANRFRRFQRTVAIGHGEAMWAFASGEVLRWGVKRRSGFQISPDADAEVGVDYRISIGRGPFVVHEPVQVVAVVDGPDRCGFAYGTLAGHPVSGEEAFIVHRDVGGTVFLTLRSLTRAAPAGWWRLMFPALLVAQRMFRRRYLRSLAAGMAG